METRFQMIGGDAVLEVTDSLQIKTRFSEKQLLLRKERLEAAIAHFDEELAAIRQRLSQIQHEKDRRK